MDETGTAQPAAPVSAVRVPNTRRRALRVALQRVVFGLLSILGAITIVFLLSHASGDPAKLMSPPGAPPGQVAAIRAQLGLDDPLWQQYLTFIGHVFTGNLGHSYYYGDSVTSVITSHVGPTIYLALVAMAYAVGVGVPLGLVAAFKSNSFVDRLLVGLSMLGQAVPSFWLGPVAILVAAVQLHWLPASGNATLSSVVLPAITLGTLQLAVIFRITRAAALEALSQDFVRLARAKGMTDRRLARCHVLPNSLLPVMTVGGLALASLIGGSVIVEVIFAWPGLGTTLMSAVSQRDFPVVQGIALVYAISFVVLNTLIDVLYAVADPRLRGVER